MRKLLAISFFILSIVVSCSFVNQETLFGRYYNIDEKGVTHYVDLKEDFTYTQYYKNDTIEVSHTHTWEYLKGTKIELLNWHTYKASDIDVFFGEKIGSKRANIIFYTNNQDLRITANGGYYFIKEPYAKKVREKRKRSEEYWANRDTFYYNNTKNIKAIGKYYLNRKHGDWQYFYPTGELESKGFYKGSKQEVWEYYYKNGNIKAIISHEGKHKMGPCEYYYENGQLKETGIYIYIYDLNDKQEKRGNWKVYDSLGNLIRIDKYPSREKYYDSLYMAEPFNRTKEEAIEKRNKRIKDLDQPYLDYKESLKDTIQ